MKDRRSKGNFVRRHPLEVRPDFTAVTICYGLAVAVIALSPAYFWTGEVFVGLGLSILGIEYLVDGRKAGKSSNRDNH